MTNAWSQYVGRFITFRPIVLNPFLADCRSSWKGRCSQVNAPLSSTGAAMQQSPFLTGDFVPVERSLVGLLFGIEAL